MPEKDIITQENLSNRKPVGLYDPELDKDSCGVGFIAHVGGEISRNIVKLALDGLCNLDHRGAVGADPDTGDGAGILMQIPDQFMRKVCAEIDIKLPEYRRYAVGFIFMPTQPATSKAVEKLIEKVVMDEGLKFLGWRTVPVNSDVPGEGARQVMPVFRQCFIEAGDDLPDDDSFERRLYLIRRVIDRRVRAELKLNHSQYYVPSFSCKTIAYKGMLLGAQMEKFFPDLQDDDFKSALAIFHTRFSTNTFPAWELAHPFRMIAHNGEINTIRGNKNWIAARQMVMESEHYGRDLKRMLPILLEGQSDSACFDNVLELLYMGGRSLPHSIMMMIPEAWSKNDFMDQELKSFYEYHANLMEPWDGPAAVAFTDGDYIGATLDRNGLRPARYLLTTDNMVVMASEAGTIPIEPERIKHSGRLQPGKMFLIDTRSGRLIDDEEIKTEMKQRHPYGQWLKDNIIRLDDLPYPAFIHQPDHDTIRERHRIFGYTTEDVQSVMLPMAQHGEEPIGSMGQDVALPVLSEQPQSFFRYFKQLFAQVTNPPVDAIREELVFELMTYVGPEGNLLSETPTHAHRLALSHPVLTNSEFEKINNIEKGELNSTHINILFDPSEKSGMRNRLDQIFDQAAQEVRQGCNLIILSDRGVKRDLAPIPSLLAVAGLHHFLIRSGLRTKTGIIIESGEPREVGHFALLLGYGANAVNPYLAFETMADLVKEGLLKNITDYKVARNNYIKAIGKGLFKIFSKMGISTLQSYCGAQIFEAIGLDSELVNTYFTGTPTRIEGLTLEMLEREVLRRHKAAFDPTQPRRNLQPGGIHYYRKNGEKHLLSPLAIAKIQNATRNNDYEEYRQYSDMINNQNGSHVTLRSLFELDYSKPAVPLKEVEPASEIVKRFSTGAMSFGSISWEAHTELAIAMNRLGGKSNTGEGGEDAKRFVRKDGEDSLRSSIKQVASGRFGVTANYLVNADDLQIKMAQGAKPGEGGQLPGHKVDSYIAKLRFSTPGVTLISPPPHHDIYSIEDLKQLIFDLKNVNGQSRVSVKLVSEVGVGTIAAGVAKAKADHILISGFDGGTGASPISSIHHAGTPWELGLSETHQTLVANGLRDRVYLAVDGKLMTGRDVAVAALLGAEEFGFATLPLVVLGCIMMRKCHLNTCPVGVATQSEELRRNYVGKPEYVVNLMLMIAEELREHMASLGFRTINEMVGQVDRLKTINLTEYSKARGLDFSRLLESQKPAFNTGLYRSQSQNHELEKQADNELIKKAKSALEKGEAVKIESTINNTDRSYGTMLSGEVARRYGEAGLPDNTIEVTATGYAGQSFGAFICRGITLRLQGMAQDYCGKGLSGGTLIARQFEKASYAAHENVIIGNTCFYGATGGEAYINGIAGERFCVRNSGAYAVVEGVGDHGCEYMTGGRVVVIGPTGRNFAAGMSGGIAYVWDPENRFGSMVNRSMVDLEKLDEKSELELVHSMLEKHISHTDSERAKDILANWKKEQKNFVKVIPGDYKLALLKVEEEKADEIDDREIVTNADI